MAAAPVKAPESLAESQMRQLDNQVKICTLPPVPWETLGLKHRCRNGLGPEVTGKGGCPQSDGV